MTELRVASLPLPAAAIGPDNPLPALAAPRDVHATVARSADIPAADQRYMGYGQPPGILPYRHQDQYTRALQTRAFRAVILENDILCATVLPELGGRLWSLRHKPSGRQLVDVNPVVQPANLAIRNAWCSGGVEWNIGLIGHCPFTCSPIFAARLNAADGTPVLRLYEWERIRCVPFQVDIYLPDGSPVLYVRVQIRNPGSREIPMYWWSNIAVPETPETRVIVPADTAYNFSYDHCLRAVQVPQNDGLDVSYSTRHRQATDYFFRIPDNQQPWIAAIDGSGAGLFQTSTPRLQGRKLFLWGQDQGGKRWQTFLARPGHAYIEIQAGLARTQMEHLPMPAGAAWSWLEAYGLAETDPQAVHGDDWRAACRAVQNVIDMLAPAATLAAELTRTQTLADQEPEAIIQYGSGWGALEQLRRQAGDEQSLPAPGTVFAADSMTADQAPWQHLLSHGFLPSGDPESEPGAFMVQPEWRVRLEASAKSDAGNHWLTWLHLGVMRCYARDLDGSAAAFRRSSALSRNVWALRNLAVLAGLDKRLDEAADLLEAALRLRPDLLCIAKECGAACLAANRAERWLELVRLLPPTVRDASRVRLAEARAALATGDLEYVERYLAEAPVIADMREGEISLTDIWFRLQEARGRQTQDLTPPAAIDFRMRP